MPWQLANGTVTVRLYHRHFEVLRSDGSVAMRRSHVVEQDKGKLQIDNSHFEGMPGRSGERGPGVARRLEDNLMSRFPVLAELVEGIQQRMKGLAHVHLRILSQLATRYGDEAFVRAGEQAIRRDLKPPEGLGDAVRLVARLGGYLDRKSDPPPGHQVIWRGYTKLRVMCEAFLLCRQDGGKLPP